MAAGSHTRWPALVTTNGTPTSRVAKSIRGDEPRTVNCREYGGAGARRHADAERQTQATSVRSRLGELLNRAIRRPDYQITFRGRANGRRRRRGWPRTMTRTDARTRCGEAAASVCP